MLKYLCIWGDVMLKMKDILDEKDARLRLISKDVSFPLDNKDKKAINDMIEYLTKSQIEEISEEEICAAAGEGCLSVNREVDGYVIRYARVKVQGYDINGNKIVVRAREELAIAFQHEIDHLNGILFIDKVTNDIEGIRTI